MTAVARVIRLLPDGPAGEGISPLTVDPAWFQSDVPEQHLHLYYSDPAIGLRVGLWDTTTMQEAFGPYPGDEFVLVLEGAFAMIDSKGKGTAACKGQSVIFRNGTPTSWVQPGYLKKFFITLLDPNAPVPEIGDGEGGIVVLGADLTLSDSDASNHSQMAAKQRNRVLFTNDAGTMEVGLWDTEAMTTDFSPCATHKYVQVLEGSVIITNEDGTNEIFEPGDVFFIPQGAVTRWDVPNYLRNYYASVSVRLP